MPKNHSIQQLPPIDVELPSPKDQPPLVFNYADGQQSICAVYPQALAQLQQQQPQALLPKPELPSSRDRRPDPLVVALVWFVMGLGLALPLTALAMVFEAMNPTVEVQHYGR